MGSHNSTKGKVSCPQALRNESDSGADSPGLFVFEELPVGGDFQFQAEFGIEQSLELLDDGGQLVARFRHLVGDGELLHLLHTPQLLQLAGDGGDLALQVDVLWSEGKDWKAQFVGRKKVGVAFYSVFKPQND